MLLFENVKALANKKGMSIGELEKAAGLSNGAIFKWKVSNPKIDSVQAVAKVLKVKVDKLLEQEGGTKSGIYSKDINYLFYDCDVFGNYMPWWKERR